MRRILMLSLVAAAACGPASGELEVDWTFSGVSCADAGVATIQVAITNELLSQDTFTCQEASFGVGLGTYREGNYEVTVYGYDAAGTITHQLTQVVPVHGGRMNQYAIDVPQVAESSLASANMSWTFDGKSCAAAGIDSVTILVDPDSNGSGGINAGTVSCSTMGTDGASVEALSAGTHTFAILGSRGRTLMYRTHHPPAYFFAAGLITDVFVSAESLP